MSMRTMRGNWQLDDSGGYSERSHHRAGGNSTSGGDCGHTSYSACFSSGADLSPLDDPIFHGGIDGDWKCVAGMVHRILWDSPIPSDFRSLSKPVSSSNSEYPHATCGLRSLGRSSTHANRNTQRVYGRSPWEPECPVLSGVVREFSGGVQHHLLHVDNIHDGVQCDGQWAQSPFCSSSTCSRSSFRRLWIWGPGVHFIE